MPALEDPSITLSDWRGRVTTLDFQAATDI
jgi:hypothetical protein